jgi:hypothetical protein
VIPFPDSGDPCASSQTLDCARFSQTTCGTGSTTCPRQIFGCADAAYFAREDYSQCLAEAGPSDAAPVDEVGLFENDASSGADAPDASEAGDARRE